MEIENEAILELVAQNRLHPDAALRLIKAKDREKVLIGLVSEHRVNAVAASFLLEPDEHKAGRILLEVCQAIQEMENHAPTKADNADDDDKPKEEKTRNYARERAKRRDVLDDPNIAAISAMQAADILGISRNTASSNYRKNGFLLPNVPVLGVGRRRIVSTFHLREALGLPHPIPTETH